MLPNGWTCLTFKQLINEGHLQIGDGYRAKVEELGGDGLIFLRAGHVTDTHVDFDGVDRFKSSLTLKVASKMSQVGDVMVTTKGNSTGRVGYVKPDYPPFVYSPHLSFWRSLNKQAIDSGFLRFWSRGNEFKEQLDALKSSTDMAPYLSLIDQQRLHITLPTLDEQRAIARILGALDHKIELNREMNRTLEAIAQSLFKSWFVDFDPVTAKAARRTPFGMNAQTAALFPSRFVESDFGLIPEGWRVGTVNEVANVTSGKRPGNRSSVKTPDLNVPLFGGGGVMGYVEKPLYVEPILVTGRVGTLGEIFRVSYPCWTSDNTLVLVAKDSRFRECLYHQLLEIDFQSFNRGSTQPLVTQGDLQKQPLLIPQEEVVVAFSNLTSTLFKQCDSNQDENLTLTALRDMLLPKLLSGEIRVREAERELEQVV